MYSAVWLDKLQAETKMQHLSLTVQKLQTQQPAGFCLPDLQVANPHSHSLWMHEWGWTGRARGLCVLMNSGRKRPLPTRVTLHLSLPAVQGKSWLVPTCRWVVITEGLCSSAVCQPVREGRELQPSSWQAVHWLKPQPQICASCLSCYEESEGEKELSFPLSRKFFQKNKFIILNTMRWFLKAYLKVCKKIILLIMKADHLVWAYIKKYGKYHWVLKDNWSTSSEQIFYLDLMMTAYSDF